MRIDLPGIDQHCGFAVKAYIITKQGQFDANVPATVFHLNPMPTSAADDNRWGDSAKTRWQSDRITLSPGAYLYRFEITGPGVEGGRQTRSLFFGDPCARETDAGVFSVFHIPNAVSPAWTDDAFKLPLLEEIILYELNVAATQGEGTVLPLFTLYRKLGQLRKNHPALRGPRENAKEEYGHTTDRLIVYRRWKENEVIIVALNFSDNEQYAPVPFGHAGIWVDVLDATFNHSPYEKNVVDPSAHEWVPIPSNFGRILRLR